MAALISPDRNNRESFEISKRPTLDFIYKKLGFDPKRDTTTQEDAQEAKDVRLVKNKEIFFCQEKLREYCYYNKYQDFTMELEGVIGADWGTFYDLNPQETKYFLWATGDYNDSGQTPDLRELWFFETETLIKRINEIAGEDIKNYKNKELKLLYPDYQKHLAAYISKTGDYDPLNKAERKRYLGEGVYKIMIQNAEKYFRSRHIMTNGRARMGGSCAFPASFITIPMKDLGFLAVFHQEFY
jgi:hypothetical protein